MHRTKKKDKTKVEKVGGWRKKPRSTGGGGGSPSLLFLPSFPTPNLACTPPSSPVCLRVTAQSPLWGTGRQPRCSPPLKRVAFQQEAWWGKNKSHLHDIGTFYWSTMKRSQESKGGDGLFLAVFLYFLFFPRLMMSSKLPQDNLKGFCFQEISVQCAQQSCTVESS